MKKERLRIEKLKKGMLLKEIRLQVFEGEIIHCVFDNIQEKQMFLKIATGEEKADYGKVWYGEREIPENQVSRLLRSKIAVVSNKSNLIDSVTIEENIFLIRAGVEGNWVKSRRDKRHALEIFQEFGLEIDVDKPMSRLTPFERVQIEIIKAYLVGKRIIILTSLTNTLSSNEKQRVSGLLEQLREKGMSGIIVEPLEDIDFVYTDTVVIIKHGRTCAMKDILDCDYTMLHTMLYYDEMEKRSGERTFLFEEQTEDAGVEIAGLVSAGLDRITVQVKRGEIVKLLCMDEKSFEEITGVFRGKLAVLAGSLVIRGEKKEIKRNIRGLKDGVGIAEGNPAAATLFEELSAMDNLQLLLSQKANGIWTKPKYKKSIKILLRDILTKDIYKKKIRELSSIDIQKVLYSRWLLYSPDILVCIQPFAEGDIQAREMARTMIYKVKERGIPILIITSNTAELNYCSGRAVYMKNGRMISKEEAHRFLYSGD
ncbi:hypothetical protein C818_01663 [Lachnospiraceae bacterium MD308]|nr:hypothetical protein C818_01663 [Lachnospiraceae bacterium MD308]MCI8502233.1 sugar ABC transporter ATP-binding protein [Dorea sp.]